MRIELSQIGRFTLKKPVALTARFDCSEGVWCVENEALALSGYGQTPEEAVRNLEESLESLMVGFNTFPDEKLGEKSKEIKRKLLHYIDF